jgi:hypothetical protein
MDPIRVEHGELSIARKIKRPIKEGFEFWTKGEQVTYRRDGVSAMKGVIRNHAQQAPIGARAIGLSIDPQTVYGRRGNRCQNDSDRARAAGLCRRLCGGVAACLSTGPRLWPVRRRCPRHGNTGRLRAGNDRGRLRRTSPAAVPASFTAVPRSLASAASPSLGGALLAAGFLAAPLILCGR